MIEKISITDPSVIDSITQLLPQSMEPRWNISPDANDNTSTGMFYYSIDMNKSINLPAGADYGILVVFTTKIGYILQMYVDLFLKGVYIRARTESNSWSKWKSITLSS